jgi:hypothetical protein
VIDVVGVDSERNLKGSGFSFGDGARPCAMMCVPKQCTVEKIEKLERDSIFDSIDSTI